MSQSSSAASSSIDVTVLAPTEMGDDKPKQHYWTHSIFPGQHLSTEHRQACIYHGVWPGCSGCIEPWLLSVVKGLDSKGRPFRWIARRHRKRVAQPHQIPDPRPPIHWLGCLNVAKHYKNISWWIALFFTIGSILFVISGIAGTIQSVAEPATQPPGVKSLTAGLLGWTNAVAANLCFFPAGLMQVAETNMMNLVTYHQKGHLHLLGLWPTRNDLITVSWWAVMIQLLGMLGFNIGCAAYLASTAVSMSPDMVDWLINFTLTWGGTGFTVSAILQAFEATGSWWRGLVPTRLRDLQSITWHSVFWNFHGSLGFLIGGVSGYYSGKWSFGSYAAMAGYGNLGGAIWFLLSALAMLLEQNNPSHP